MLLIWKTFLLFILFNSKLIHSEVSNSLKSDNQTQEVIKEILNNRCVLAEEQLLKISNYSDKIPTVVREVYNGSEKNINSVLKCVKDMKKIDISYKVLKNLQDEMKSFGHRSPLNMISIAQTLESEVLQQTYGNNWKPFARNLVDELISDIEGGVLKVLKAAMLAQKYQGNPEVRELADAIFLFRRNISDNIMQRLVNESFGRIPSQQMADDIFEGNWKIPQIVMGLLALFEKLESTNNMNSEAVIRIAKNIRKLKVMNNYPTLPRKKKIAVNRLIEKLPVCAKNLFFAKHPCIWNRGKQEYLYASDGQFYFTRRSVFTNSLEYITNDGIWIVEEINDKFYFQNNAHSKEYLYASTTDRYGGSGYRLVETWMDLGFLGETSAWNIELNGNFCYIRNENFNEYMFVSKLMYSNRRRYVFTSSSKGTPNDNTDFQWQIRNCG